MLVLLSWLAAAVVPASAADAPAPRVIRASGEGAVQVTPDRARIAISVVSRAATAREATEANARTSKVVLDKLKAAVHAPGEVRTGGYDLSTVMDFNNQNNGRGPTLIGYIATNRLSIVSADLAGVGDLIDSAVGAGANQVDSIGFFLADQSQAGREALLEAGHQARAEAEAIAASLGVSVGNLLEASSTMAPAMPTPVSRMMAADVAGAPSTEVVPGTLEVHAGVAATFEIR
jgi:hypothetical protein